jgi:aminobenzoyl-glutamate transport protein
MTLVIILLDIIIPGVIPKWAIFAPVFIPIFTRLGGAADRAGGVPGGDLAHERHHTPLMVYLPFVVTARTALSERRRPRR